MNIMIDAFEMMYLKILWKMEHENIMENGAFALLEQCSIFHNIFKSIQNLT